MGVSYQIDKSAGLVLTRAFGRIENDDLLLHNHKLKKDPIFSTYYSQIIDLTDVTLNGLTKDIVSEMMKTSPFSQRSLRAIVAPLDREYEFINNQDQADYSSNIQAFRKREEALEWVRSAKVKI